PHRGIMTGTITVLDGSTPPITMTKVELVLSKKKVTQIRVDFSGAPNAGDASNLALYRLATAGKKGSFTAQNSKLIKLKAAALDAVRNEVTLTLQKPFKVTKAVQLRVSGAAAAGLHDSLGRLIDGDRDGQPGGNALAVISRTGVSLS